MALKVKETGAYRIGTLISISGLTPSAWTWNIVEDGKIVTGYEPVALFIFDCIADDGGLVRTGFTVREKGPHFTLEGSTRKLFTSLSALLAYHHVEGATVTMTRRFFTSGGSSEEITEVVGTIVRIEDESAASKSFAVELRSEVANATLPRVMVKKGGGQGLSDARIPEESVGEAVPVPIGRFRRYLGRHFANDGSGAWRIRYPVNFRPTVIPAVEVYRSSTESRFAWADYLISGGLRIGDVTDLTNVGEDAAFIYLPEDDAYAWIQETGTNLAWDAYNGPWQSNLYTAKVLVKPWITAGFLPPRVLSTSLVVDADKCINGEPFDYAIIQSGGSIYLEVPQPKYRGRISQNSKDGGTPGAWAGGDGSDAPCGLSVRVVLVAPVDVGPISAATLNVNVVFPGDDTALFGLTATTVSQPTTIGTGAAVTHELPYRNQSDGTFNGADDGWGGTKFHVYDFTSSPSGAAGDPDFPLYNSGGSNSGKTEPFRIKLSVASSPAGRSVYVSDVRWVVGAHHQVEPWQPGLSKRRTKKTDAVGRRVGKATEWAVDYYGDPGEQRWWLSGRHAWDRGVGQRQSQQRERPALQNVYVSKCSYVDDGSIIGSAGLPLVSPVDQAHFLLSGYGKQTSFQIVSGTFGNLTDARTLLDKWAELHGAGTKFEMDFLQLSESDVNSAVLDLTSHAPGLLLCKSRIGAWSAHVWYPDPAGLLAYEQYGAEVNPLRCLKTGNGVALSFGWSDAGSIVNDLTINYGWDPGRGKFLWTAACNPDDYNDGQGADWPHSIFGAEPTALCDWSQGNTAHPRYGVRKATIELHGCRDGRVATALGASVLARNYRRVPILSMTMDAAYCDMQYGHLFTLNHNAMLALGHAAPAWAGVASWGSVWWRCTHAETQGVDGAIATVIEAEWMPTTIGGEISGFAPEEEEGSL